MGDAAAAAVDPRDIHVTILRTEVVAPPPSPFTDGTQASVEPFFLANIDQVLNFPVETVHFFRSNPEFHPVETGVAERLRSALQEMFVPYEWLAGRLRTGADGRLEIECNGKGAVLVVAAGDVSLADLGDLACPNAAFWQLVSRRVTAVVDGSDGEDDKPLCIMQVTSFTCGGFALGICLNHVTFDGISVVTFLRNLAAAAGGRPLVETPCNDRRLLQARSPPHVDFPHPELFNIASGCILDKPPTSAESTAELQCRIFPLTEKDISFLKYKAMGTADPAATRVSSFNAVTAHLWRCRALAVDPAERRTETSMVLYAVDLRPRLDPPLPKSFTGNAVLSAYASVTYEELGDDAFFGRAAEAVRSGATRMNDKYARSVIDWGELNKGFPVGDIFVSSWWRLGLTDVEYPWGKPVYSGPVADPSKDFVLLCPPGPGESGQAAGPGGVTAQVALPAGEMERFEKLFYKFLER